MRKLLLGAMLMVAISGNPSQAFATIINFDFTGRMTAGYLSGSEYFAVYNPLVNTLGPDDYLSYQVPISASLSFDTTLGIGSSNLQIQIADLLGAPALIHDINFTQQAGSNLLNGNMLIDAFGMTSVAYIQWDATGLVNALNYGLQVGDKISGTSLYRDFNGDSQYDASEMVVSDLGSVVPFTDYGLICPGAYSYECSPNQGPAPMAATEDSLGIAGGPNEGLRIYLDIGSGNSMHVTSIQAVPIPAAVWLFGSGLLGLIGIAKRKT
ncbi:MAG: VPLPA-CTERM sorting domain-containing protein [Gammaproteobacteria bacterium]|nr:VPLPA-CTERM sorting domain-containing protein [Gammaproteobacteria bacterium]